MGKPQQSEPTIGRYRIRGVTHRPLKIAQVDSDYFKHLDGCPQLRANNTHALLNSSRSEPISLRRLPPNQQLFKNRLESCIFDGPERFPIPKLGGNQSAGSQSYRYDARRVGIEAPYAKKSLKRSATLSCRGVRRSRTASRMTISTRCTLPLWGEATYLVRCGSWARYLVKHGDTSTLDTLVSGAERGHKAHAELMSAIVQLARKTGQEQVARASLTKHAKEGYPSAVHAFGQSWLVGSRTSKHPSLALRCCGRRNARCNSEDLRGGGVGGRPHGIIG